MKSLTGYGIVLTIFLFSISQNGYTQNNNDAEMEEMLRLVNEIRTQNGAQPLRLNIYLNDAAYKHSKDMGENNYFDHTGLNGSSFSERAIASGYQGSPRSENIAAGNAKTQATFQQWVNSSGHLNNMLNSGHNEMGIGHATVNGSTYTHYWTQIFGKGDENLSVTDHIIEQNTTIYPNPVKDILHISFQNKNPETTDLKITSMTGQVVYQKDTSLNTDLTLNLNYLPKGIYFLTFQNFKAKKIIKQ